MSLITDLNYTWLYRGNMASKIARIFYDVLNVHNDFKHKLRLVHNLLKQFILYYY